MIFCTSRGRDLDRHIRTKEETVFFNRSVVKIDQIMEDALTKIKLYHFAWVSPTSHLG